MRSNKTKFWIYLSLFLPSALGIVFYVSVSGATLILYQIDSIKQVLELPRNLELTRVIVGWADTLLTKTIGESHTETLVVGFFWAMVGLVVYLFLRSLAQFASEFDDDLQERRFVWPKGVDRYRPLRVLFEQAAFRTVAFVLLIMVVLGPLAAVLKGPVLVDFLGPNQTLQYTVWFFASMLLWHTVTVLLRLIALKARLFG